MNQRVQEDLLLFRLGHPVIQEQVLCKLTCISLS